MYICTCNNCNKIYEDTNNGYDSIAYPDISLNQLIIEEDCDGDLGRVCPLCHTDEHLVDNVREDLKHLLS